MKELTSYNRVAGYLNKMFDLLNAEFFESTLSRPTITIQSTPRAYGHFSLQADTWVSKLVLASGENNHSRSIENNQFQSNKNNQSKIRKRSQPSLGM